MLCPVERVSDQQATCYLYAVSWPVEVNLKAAVQDLSDHRYGISQELDRSNAGKGPNAVLQPESEELIKTMISCEDQAEFTVALTYGKIRRQRLKALK